MDSNTCPHCGRRSSSPVDREIVLAQPFQSFSNVRTEELQQALDTLETDLNALYERSKDKSYGAIKALFLNWEHCNLDPVVQDETKQLQSVLRDEYGFEAGTEPDIFKIPDQLPEQQLQFFLSSQILSFSQLDAQGKDKLLIVYYNGHGDIDEVSKNFIISGGMINPNSKSSYITADWAVVQSQLERVTDFDILLLMDCCYATRLVKAISVQAMEVLCAVSREVTAGLNWNTGSFFTTALIKHLKASSADPAGMLISQLALDLHTDATLSEQSPNHVVLKGHHKPIVLRPLGLGGNPAPTTTLAERTENNTFAYSEEDTRLLQIFQSNLRRQNAMISGEEFELKIVYKDKYYRARARVDDDNEQSISSNFALQLDANRWKAHMGVHLGIVVDNVDDDIVVDSSFRYSKELGTDITIQWDLAEVLLNSEKRFVDETVYKVQAMLDEQLKIFPGGKEGQYQRKIDRLREQAITMSQFVREEIAQRQ